MVDRRSRPRLSKRERELDLLLRIERAITHLRQHHARPTQNWDFLVEPLAMLRAERVILQSAMGGDPDAKMLRQTRRGVHANDTMGQ